MKHFVTILALVTLAACGQKNADSATKSLTKHYTCSGKEGSILYKGNLKVLGKEAQLSMKATDLDSEVMPLEGLVASYEQTTYLNTSKGLYIEWADGDAAYLSLERQGQLQLVGTITFPNGNSELDIEDGKEINLACRYEIEFE